MINVGDMVYQVGHVVRQGSGGSHGGDDLGDPGGHDLPEEVAGRGGRVRGGNDGAHDGDAVEGLCRGPGGGEDGARVGAVDAADADGGHGAVAGCREGGEDVADSRGADDGSGILFAGGVSW